MHGRTVVFTDNCGFARGQQHDAHEFLTSLLQTISVESE